MKRVEGNFTVRASQQEVLDYYGDLRNVFPALPGLAEVKEATAESGVVVINAGVSFIRGRFTVRLAQTARTANGLRFSGHGDGVGNAIDFDSSLDVAPSDDGMTVVNWASEVRVHGPLASMGAGLLNPVINQNVETFVGNIRKGLEGAPAVTSDAAATAAVSGAKAPASFMQKIVALVARLFSRSTKSTGNCR